LIEMTYKTITIKKKGGGTRKQRVKVLKSGKFKFVKNITRRARARKSRVSKPKRRRRILGRRRGKRRGGGKSISQQAMKWIRVAALVAPGAHAAMSEGTNEQKITRAIRYYTGYELTTGEWKPGELSKGWGPYLAAIVMTYGIPKLAGIIRRM